MPHGKYGPLRWDETYPGPPDSTAAPRKSRMPVTLRFTSVAEDERDEAIAERDRLRETCQKATEMAIRLRAERDQAIKDLNDEVTLRLGPDWDRLLDLEDERDKAQKECLVLQGVIDRRNAERDEARRWAGIMYRRALRAEERIRQLEAQVSI